jgi:hypothetical protein
MPRYAFAASLILTLALAAAWPYRLLGQGSERDLSMSNKLVIRIGDKTFAATVEDNATAAAFRKLLPLSVTMRDLNANEKLYRLPSAIPTNPSTPQSIQTGDLLLYGSNTVVLFYKSFPTTYSYTRIGRVDDPTGLEAAVGSGDVAVTFEARREKP